MIVEVVHDDVEERDSSTCVFGVLLHEEQIFRHFVFLQGGSFSLFVVTLQFVDLVEKHQA